jgi:predicted ATPase/DNA-binding CsgD family transcriptional regulator
MGEVILCERMRDCSTVPGLGSLQVKVVSGSCGTLLGAAIRPASSACFGGTIGMPEVMHPRRGEVEGEHPRLVAVSDRCPAAKSARHNLPYELSSLVGRERELVEVERLLGRTRLLTLTGPGGCGKTRLAVAVAGDVVDGFAGGAWWVELAPLADSALVAPEVAAALGVQEQPGRSVVDTLVDCVRTRDMLLVLDNCEHLIDACSALVMALLRSCQRLRVLATSREVFGIVGEVSWPVPSLSVPDFRLAMTPESVAEYDAVALFIQRAKAVAPEFVLSPENVAAVAGVCVRLDGLPLAIELAARRTKVLAVQQIASRLDGCLRVLGEGRRAALPRHRTLHATLDWSHDLLTEPERVVFRRVSVFAGGFTLDAAEAVCLGEGDTNDELTGEDVLDLVAHLVDKSLVFVVAEEKQVRYRMLETVRQYARQRLADSGEQDATRRRHAHWYLAFALEAESRLRGPDQGAWLDRLQTEHDDLRAALRWSHDERGEPELGLRLAAALWWFWVIRGHLGEGLQWLARAADPDSQVSPSAQAKALGVAGSLALHQGNYDTAITVLELGLTGYRELADTDGIAATLPTLGLAKLYGQRTDVDIPELVEEAMRLRPQVKSPHVAADLLVLTGMCIGTDGDWSRAAELCEKSLTLCREVGDLAGTLRCLPALGFIALVRGEDEVAVATLAESLRLAAELDFKVVIQYVYYFLGCVAVNQGQATRAARLWGASDAMGETYATTLSDMLCSATSYQDRLDAARAQLGDEAFVAARAEGRSMLAEQVVSYALQPAGAPERPVSPVPVYPAGLSAREVEVLRLVAEGKSNTEVAAELFLSARTINWHLSSIYRKLGCRSRTEATRFAVDHGIVRQP